MPTALSAWGASPEHYRKQAEALSRSLAQGSVSQRKTGAVLRQSVEAGKSWWAWEMQASAESDLDKRNEIYLQGLKQFPQSAELTCNYANFLADQRKDYDAAEALYKKALELDPSNANHAGNYAMLADQRKDYDAAEALYKKALELDPSHANNTGNYASFLANPRKDYNAAEALYKKALELDPSNANNTGNYASLLLIRGDSSSLAMSESLIQHVITLSAGAPSQALAEALLDGSLLHELLKASPDTILARLKVLLAMDYPRGNWDFSAVFEAVLPKIEPENVALYRALGVAILDGAKVSALDAFERWRRIDPTDPFQDFKAQ